MKRSLLFIIISFAFLFAGADALAQDTKHADPRYLELDEHPTFKGGGPNNFASWVAAHVRYPKDAKEAGVEGTVMVCFVVDKDGSISDAHVHESTHPLLDAEAIDGFTVAQRFYISYATIWGQNIRDEEAARLTKVDVHSLGKNRVNATLRNIQTFYDAFGITDGAMFLPEEERVVIW